MKTKNKIVITSLATIAVAGGIAGGATYALFTSEDSANIAITSGKVDLTANMSGIKLYSAQTEDVDNTGVVLPGSHDLGIYSHDYYHVEQTSGFFYTGGTAEITTGGDLSLTNVVSGDKAVTNLHLDNNSNVAIKYRVVVEPTAIGGGALTDEDLRFFSNLTFEGLGFELTNFSKLVTEWKVWEAGNPEYIDEEISISVPLTIDNKLQNRSCNVKFSVEAVQSNAYTEEGVTVNYLEFTDKKVEADPLDPSKLLDVELQAGNVTTQIGDDALIKASIPCSTGGVKADNTPIKVDDVLTLKVNEVDPTNTIEEVAKEIASQLEIKYENTTLANYDVKVMDQDDVAVTSTTKAMTVQIYIGENMDAYLMGVIHTHNNYSSPLTRLYSDVEIGWGEDGYYTYSASTGYITLWTSNFSDFSVLLNNLPMAKINKLEGVEIEYEGMSIPMTCCFNFQSTESAEEVYNYDLLEDKLVYANPFAYYHADYVVSFDQDVNQESSDLEYIVENGGIVLLGHYDTYSAETFEEWVPYSISSVAGEEVRLLDGVYVNYLELCLTNYKDYNCLREFSTLSSSEQNKKYPGLSLLGSKSAALIDEIDAMYAGTSEYTGFMMPGFTCGAIAVAGEQLTTPVTITVKLRLYEVEVIPGQLYNVETGNYIDVSTTTFTFNEGVAL